MVFLGEFCWRISRQPTSRSAAVRRYIYHQRQLRSSSGRNARSTQSAELQRDWLAERRKPVARLPVDYSGERTRWLRRTPYQSHLIRKKPKLYQQVPKAYNTQINDVLLTALVQAFAEWTGERCWWIKKDGREDIRRCRPVAHHWTTIFPLLLELEKASHPSDALKAVKDQLRNIPNRGLGYGVLRYLSKDVEPLQQAEVLFNYLGQSDQVFQVVAVCTSPRV